ncbi:hypothetical protein HYX13_00115 [Candidatus Woesearchaeota archaeon]|nr:hypothetical protein [Candidatus Woesearchaeota archaeon]
MRQIKRQTHKKIFFVLLVLIIFLGSFQIVKAKGWLIPQQPEVNTKNKIIDIDKLTLEQKIAQMIVVAGLSENMRAWKNMQVGGIHFYAMQTEWVYNNTIIDFQYEMPIPAFITADLEGCVSPFDNIRTFPAAAEITTLGAAFEKGYEEGKFLHRIGFTLNFAPVVDLDDHIWKCRTFPGDEKNIAQLAESYLLGLQAQGVIGTVKHYPGKTLVVKDPHKFIVAAEIDSSDLYPYDYLTEKKEAKAIMVSHIISNGVVNSSEVPAVVSPEVIAGLRKKFNGLIISDEIHMLGLKNYFNHPDSMYIALFKAGNDIILNFDKNPHEIYRMIQVIKTAVDNRELSEKQIDASVTRILEAKGFTVKK